MYTKGLLQPEITKDFFGFTALYYWELGWWFIQRCRESDDDNFTNTEYYEQWEAMLLQMDLLTLDGTDSQPG